MHGRRLALALLAGAVVVATGAWLLRGAGTAGLETDGASGATRAESPSAEDAPLKGLAGVPKGSVTAKGRDSASAPAARDGTPAPATSGKALVVRVSVGDVPREGATVRVRPKDSLQPTAVAKTGVSGLAQFENVDVRQVVLEALADGFAPTSTAGEETDRITGDDGVVDLALEPGVAFDGRVVDAASGQGLPGASVTCGRYWADFEFGPTDEHGRCHVHAGLEDRTVTIVARASGHVPGTLEVSVDDGLTQRGEALLRLKAGGALTGVVVNADGGPVPGAVVRVAPAGADVEDSAAAADESAVPAEGVRTSDGKPYFDSIDRFEYDDHILVESDGVEVLRATVGPDGAYRVEGLTFGTTYAATAKAVGYAVSITLRDVRVTLEAPQVGATIVLRRPARVLLRVAVPSGMSLPADARVRVFPRNDLVTPAGREPDGRFRFEEIAPGPASVFAQAEGFRSAAIKIMVVEGHTEEVELGLEEGASLDGVVVGPEGKPIAGAEVRVAPVVGNENRTSGRWLAHSRDATTDAQGRFSVRGMPPGPVKIVASSNGAPMLATRECISSAAPATGVRVTLAKLGSIRVRLLTPEGRPFAGEVTGEMMRRYDGQSGGGSGSGSASDDGVQQDHGLYDGEYTYLLVPKGYAWLRWKVTIRDGADVDLGDVTLDPGIAAAGRVLDAAGRPIAGVAVTCDAFTFDERRTTTDAEGRFSLEHFPREPYSLTFHLDGLSDVSVSVAPQKASALEVRMTPPATIRGVLRWPPGTAPSETYIPLRRPDAKAVHRTVLVEGVEREFTSYEDSDWIEVDATGRFTHTLPAGRWLAFWTGDDETERQIAEWTLEGGETREVEITLPAK